ncbi:MAG: hypothetical protein NC205_00660 [Prevotella sp.]|nr:hypothetical protein [Alistipes senegalensis]MCM1357074.1 hypothetical protein [Prevotella sp.]MCM1473105.1 hypothetical protein [Muribaculaceae bacterium]
MWGVCFDIAVPELFQKAVEFKMDSGNAIILKPVQNIKVSANKVILMDNAPDFVYGEIVSPVNHTDIIGKIHTIIWHFKIKEFFYYIESDGKKKSKRYYGNDLIKK